MCIKHGLVINGYCNPNCSPPIIYNLICISYSAIYKRLKHTRERFYQDYERACVEQNLEARIIIWFGILFRRFGMLISIAPSNIFIINHQSQFGLIRILLFFTNSLHHGGRLMSGPQSQSSEACFITKVGLHFLPR